MLDSTYPAKQKTITAMDTPIAQAVVSQELVVEFEECVELEGWYPLRSLGVRLQSL